MSSEADISPNGPEPSPTTLKCSIKGCTNKSDSDPKLPCAAEGCDKTIHSACYDRLLAKFNCSELIDPVNNNKYYCCSKTCWNQIDKNICSAPTRLPWDKDGKHGPTDPNSSMAILLTWLYQEGNYSRFRGDNKNSGKRKLAHGLQVSNMIKDSGCRMERTAEAVVSKIREIETKFIKAHDWVNNTGQGVKENEGVHSFEGAVRKRCPWYFELEPIMAERSKARPKATTESIGDDNPPVPGIVNLDSLLASDSDDDGMSPTSDVASARKKPAPSVASSSAGRKSKKNKRAA